jgi:hypothetical protein
MHHQPATTKGNYAMQTHEVIIGVYVRQYTRLQVAAASPAHALQKAEALFKEQADNMAIDFHETDFSNLALPTAMLDIDGNDVMHDFSLTDDDAVQRAARNLLALLKAAKPHLEIEAEACAENGMPQRAAEGRRLVREISTAIAAATPASAGKEG